MDVRLAYVVFWLYLAFILSLYPLPPCPPPPCPPPPPRPHPPSFSLSSQWLIIGVNISGLSQGGVWGILFHVGLIGECSLSHIVYNAQKFNSYNL